MGNLTSQQANALAYDFMQMANDIETYWQSNKEVLSTNENKKFKQLHWQALNNAEALFVMSTLLVMNDIENQLKKIKDITGEISITLEKIENVQKGIEIAASVVNLGASIIKKDPQAIGESIADLAKTVKEIV